jgi:hypothetical protein
MPSRASLLPAEPLRGYSSPRPSKSDASSSPRLGSCGSVSRWLSETDPGQHAPFPRGDGVSHGNDQRTVGSLKPTSRGRQPRVETGPLVPAAVLVPDGARHDSLCPERGREIAARRWRRRDSSGCKRKSSRIARSASTLGTLHRQKPGVDEPSAAAACPPGSRPWPETLPAYSRSGSAGVCRPTPSRLASPAVGHALGRHCDSAPCGGAGAKAIVRVEPREAQGPRSRHRTSVRRATRSS